MDLVAPQPLQTLELFLSFNAFCNRHHSETTPNPCNELDNREGIWPRRHFAHEGTINLDFIKRKSTQATK